MASRFQRTSSAPAPFCSSVSSAPVLIERGTVLVEPELGTVLVEPERGAVLAERELGAGPDRARRLTPSWSRASPAPLTLPGATSDHTDACGSTR
jgi:hypothetical protein